MLGWSNPDSLIRHAWWDLLRFLCYVVLVPTCRYRAWGLKNLPAKGPVLLLSNHQSYLDPIFVGMAIVPRTFHAMARSTLFRNWAFGWLLRSINVFPVERGESDMKAIRHAIAVLNRGQVLLVFPEGTRSLDGKIGTFATGTMLLIKRARPMVVPVAVEGPYRIWAKGKMPRIGERVDVCFGDPVPAEKLIDMGADAALHYLRDRVEAMRRDMAHRQE